MFAKISAAVAAFAIPAVSAAVVVTATVAATPAAAQGIETPFLVGRIKAATPRCDTHPEYGFVGRVSGIVGGHPSRGVSFTGCFPSFAACNNWRGPVSGAISGRIILATCEPRR